MPVVSSKAHRRVAALLVASMAILFTAACASSDEEGTATDPAGGNAAFTAYVDCLNENGVTITMPSGGPGRGGVRPSGAFPSGQPRPSGSAGQRGGGLPGGGFPGSGFPGGGGFSKPDGVDDATWEKAQSACASLRPSMGAGRGGNRGGNGANAAYTNCLKENGVTDTADLDASGASDASDATVQKAVETCKVLKPSATS
ncbi:hypothetical protein [Actinoplanes sp. GCM10030250]|uniref:hypothetical protein n=1 Tax=Actinoplanes sp. GCM10030250 TaxID=3273376 RepID=UPI003621BC98